jgi:D-methionine transport system ATP-binding protein
VDDVFTHTKSAAGRRLFGVVRDEDAYDEPKEAIRLVFGGETLGEPVLADFILKTGIAVNILSANMHQLNGKPYGQMLIEPPASPGDCERLIRSMRSKGLIAEEVRA